jgi:hypothetical protein
MAQLKNFKELEAIIVKEQYDKYSELELFEKENSIELSVSRLMGRIGDHESVDSQMEAFALLLNEIILLAETQNIDLTLSLNLYLESRSEQIYTNQDCVDYDVDLICGA